MQRDLAAGKARDVDLADGDVGVGDGRLAAAPAVAGGAWLGAGAVGSDLDALQGVNAGNRATAAPISTISMTGMRSGVPLPFLKRDWRSTSKARPLSGWPLSIRQILAVVPPMSKERMRLSPRSSAICPARMAPPAGPDSTSRHRELRGRLEAGEAAAEVIRWIGRV